MYTEIWWAIEALCTCMEKEVKSFASLLSETDGQVCN
jgi:hypothetical protein